MLLLVTLIYFIYVRRGGVGVVLRSQTLYQLLCRERVWLTDIRENCLGLWVRLKCMYM